MKKLLLILLLAPFLTVGAHAAYDGAAEDPGFEVGGVTEGLTEEALEIGGELRLDGSYDTSGALERLWRAFLESAAAKLRSSCRAMAGVFALILLCAIFSSLVPQQKQSELVQTAACAAISLLLAGGMNSLVGDALDVLTDLSNYGSAALPAVYTAAAASGAAASAPAKYGAACLALELMMTAAQKLILPIVCAVLAMSVCAAIGENPFLRTGIRLGRKLSALLLTALTLGFTAFLSITGLVSGSADALTVRAAKAVISTAVPVVGRMLSDAADSVLSAAALVRNSAGAFGLVAVCAICAGPFASLAVQRLLLSVTATAAEMTSCGRIARLLNDIAGVMNILLGLIAAFGFMLFFCIVAALRSVGA